MGFYVTINELYQFFCEYWNRFLSVVQTDKEGNRLNIIRWTEWICLLYTSRGV